MGNLALAGSTSGTITLVPTAIAGSNTITLPAATGTALLNTTAANQSTTSPTQQIFTSGSGTYTLPAGVKWIRVRMVGGGGGGSGSGTASAGNGGAGGNSTFGTSLLTANGGSGGTYQVNGGSGGSATIGAGASGIAYSGGSGGGASTSATNYISLVGPMGAGTPFSGGGASTVTAGLNGISNSGSGGGGAGYQAGASVSQIYSGSSGGAGGFIDAIISAPSTTYAYAIGAAGTAGTAGTSGSAGGAGGSGVIIVEEHYNY